MPNNIFHKRQVFKLVNNNEILTTMIFSANSSKPLASMGSHSIVTFNIIELTCTQLQYVYS